MKRDVKNLAASVRQRLRNKMEETKRPFAELLQYFAMERFLYRLSKSKHKDKVILKGALMFIVWHASRSRATRDIDFLARLDNGVDSVGSLVKEVCGQKVEPDGIVFDSASVAGERIKEDADYEGVRVRFIGFLENARIPMQIDFGFGDTIFPKPQELDYPALLDFPRPHLKGYPQETVVAEKFQAMVQLDILNSRMKDFYDIWLLAQQFHFEGTTLAKAIQKTFATRRTPITAEPTVFSDAFAQDKGKSIQWKAFINKNRLDHTPKEFSDVLAVIKEFLLPVVQNLSAGNPAAGRWKVSGPWKYKMI